MKAASRHAPSRAAIAVVDGIKVFQGVRALDRVDFAVRAGEIHALVGANGAGKSTLMRILAGDTGLTSGALEVGGREVTFKSPADAMAAGVAMVYQETSLVPDVSVARNLVLGHEPALIGEARIEASADTLLAGWGSEIEAGTRAERLGTAQRQIVEIARAVARRARVLVLDEPTASLTPRERSILFANIRSARARGLAIVLVTHDLGEALGLADRVTVLRDGRVVETRDAAKTTRALLSKLMVPPEASKTEAKPVARRPSAEPRSLLDVAGLCVGGFVQDVAFSLQAGEVLGLTGLLGSGRTEIAKAIAGVETRGVKGTIKVLGSPVRFKNPAQAIRHGVVYVTEDRQREGVFGSLLAEANIALGVRAAGRSGSRRWFGGRAALQVAASWIERFSVKSLGPGARLADYSGGNQQKVIIARGLAQDPDIIIFDEPTRGVDVASVGAIYSAIREIADRGKGVIVVSSEPREIVSLCDRVIVLSNGRVANVLGRDALTEANLIEAVLG